MEVCVIQTFGRLNQEASYKSEATLGGGKIWLSTWLNQESPGERLSKRFPALSWLMCISVGAVLTALMDVGKPDLWYRPRQRTCFAGNVFAHLAFTVWQVHLPHGCCWEFLHWYQNHFFRFPTETEDQHPSRNIPCPWCQISMGETSSLLERRNYQSSWHLQWVSHCWTIPYKPWDTISYIFL